MCLYIEIFYNNICFGSWENVRNLIKMCFLEHFQEYNQIPENIFKSIFWNATKHLKMFSFLKNIFTWKYFTLGKQFTLSQTQPYYYLLYLYYNLKSFLYLGSSILIHKIPSLYSLTKLLYFKTHKLKHTLPVSLNSSSYWRHSV